MGAGGGGGRLGHIAVRLRVLAHRFDLGLCRCPGSAKGDSAVIIAILIVYLVLLFILVKLRIVPFNLFWKISPAIVFVLLLFGLFVPMGWGAPSGPTLVVRNSVSIVPNVAGEVIDVPVEANTPIKAGDVLFKIDPTPYQAQVDALTAQLKFEELRLSQMAELQKGPAGRAFDVEERQANVDQLKDNSLEQSGTSIKLSSAHLRMGT
jgi:multidrug resistance efflux pump